MKIAVINSGSSSLKCKVYDMDAKILISSKLIQKIGEKDSEIKNHHDALLRLNLDFSGLDAVGHRVVHGGEDFKNPVVINAEVISKITELIPLAPLHNPANLEGIKVVSDFAPNIPQIAVFDTSFHANMPPEAFIYALPFEMYEKHKIRRYGFHGTSHAYVCKEAAKILQKGLGKLNLISLHLGNGASACAIERGISIDTSMGFTPLEGLVMGTRSGDIDPAIILYLQRELGMSVNEVDILLNKESGLVGLCKENDVRKIIASDESKAKLSIDIMVRRIQKYIGSYMALLGEVDALVFTGGIGENSSYIRERVLESKLFKDLEVLVIKTDEELEIANECMHLITA